MSDAAESRPFPVIVPLAVAGGVLMEGLDSTIIATSLPQMSRSLGVSPASLSLAITSYLLSLAIFVPISGWMADRFGARRIYCIAIAIFAASSGFCALAGSLGFLVSMRIVQGLGGAMLTPVARLILIRAFAKSEYLKAMTYMTVPALIGPMLGPVIGGFITAAFSWHWIFLINIPLGIANILLVLRLVDDLPARRPPPFDFTGFVIAGFGFALVQAALECVGRRIVGVPAQVGLFVVAAAVLGGYALHARNRANPVLDLQLLRLPNFSASVIWGGLSRIGIGGSPFLLPLLFQVGFGFDPFHAGVLVFVSTAGAFFMRLGFSRVLRLWGLRPVLIVNTLILAVLLLGFAAFQARSPQLLLVAYLFVFGFMRSVQFLSLNMLSFADLAGDNVSRGTSLYSIGQRLSISAGVAVAAVALSVASGDGAMSTSHFQAAFVAMSLFELLAIIGFWRLDPAAGGEITGHE